MYTGSKSSFICQKGVQQPHNPLEIVLLFPKKAENPKEIQAVLNMPQLKMLKPTDIHWLSHENTIRSVKRLYIALVVTLEAIYEESGDAEPHGLSQLLKKLETVATIYMLSGVLGCIARLCKGLQMKGFDLVHVPLAVSSILQELHAIQVLPTDAAWYNSRKEKISELNIAGILLWKHLMKHLALFIEESLILSFHT